MEVTNIKKMKDIEDENLQLKQMFADLSLECHALNETREIIERWLAEYNSERPH